jgi:hypothetical protein
VDNFGINFDCEFRVAGMLLAPLFLAPQPHFSVFSSKSLVLPNLLINPDLDLKLPIETQQILEFLDF